MAPPRGGFGVDIAGKEGKAGFRHIASNGSRQATVRVYGATEAIRSERNHP